MNVDKSNKDKSITKTDRLSKYNRINTWVESSGLLTDEQIDIIIEADRRMMLEESTDAVNSSISGEDYFNKPEYLESSPLSENQKEEMSKTEVGETDFENLGDFKFLKE